MCLAKGTNRSGVRLLHKGRVYEASRAIWAFVIGGLAHQLKLPRLRPIWPFKLILGKAKGQLRFDFDR